MLQLLDLAGIYFRAFYALPSSLTGPHGRPVNAIRGSLDILARVIADARPTRVIACLDVDWRPAWRVALLPSYKTHRVAGPVDPADPVDPAGPADPADPADPDAPAAGSASGPPVAEALPDGLSEQVPVLLDVLRAIGIAIAGAPQAEADDVIGTLVAGEGTDPVEVVSGDRDLFQVIRTVPTPVTVRYIGAGMARAEVIDDGALRARYGVDGRGYAAMATLRGDASDGLPGVRGIGEKTAAALISAHHSIEGLLAALADPAAALSPSNRTRLAAARDYLTAAPAVVLVRTDADVCVEPAGDGTLPRTPVAGAALEVLIAEHGIGASVQRMLDAIAGRPAG